MNDVDKILARSYEAKFLKYANSVLFPLYSGVLIFTGAIVVFLLNQTTSNPIFFSIAIILVLILAYLAALTLYFKAKYEEYSRKFKTIIIREAAANSSSTSFEELVKEITDKTFFDEEDVKTILFRLLHNRN
jgi:hypothetical protein